MTAKRESWRISRPSRDIEGVLCNELAVARVTYLPDVPPFVGSNIHVEHEREILRLEQQLFLQTMASMEDIEGDVPAAFDLRIGKLAASAHSFIAIIGRVTSRDPNEAATYGQHIWNRMETAFPRSYGFRPSLPQDAGFLEAVLPELSELEQASIWELVKGTCNVRVGERRSLQTVGTYAETLDSMTACWNAVARFPERVLLSIRCMPLPAVEAEAAKYRATRLYRALEDPSLSGMPTDPEIAASSVWNDIPLIEEARHRLDNLLSSTQLFRIRIQVAAWHSDPLAIMAALKASLTTALDSRQRSCECSWERCTSDPDSERAHQVFREMAFVHVEKREVEDDSDAEPALPGRSAYQVPDYDLVTVTEASAAWRLPLARRYGISGIEFKRDPLFTQEPLSLPPATRSSVIKLGRVMSRSSEGNEQYLPGDKLTRHVLVVGETGAGKSTTTLSMVLQLWEAGIPSLIIDPVSTEYRDLWNLSPIFGAGLTDEEKKEQSLCVFTPGAAGPLGTALAFNPFCPQAGMSLNAHIMTMKECFTSAFGLPDGWKELVGRAIRSSYQELGWLTNDIQANREPITLIDIQRRPFPTIIDLIKATEQETAKYRMGDFRSNTEAGLLGRLRDLAVGPLGTMIQTHRGLDVERLVKRPVVIELNRIGAADATSLIMLFLLTQLRQYYDARQRAGSLWHFLIIEEAHRLLSPSPVIADTPDNSRSESVAIVVNMLAELRKVGVGLMLVEQLPTRLEQNVVKLPGTKILHRLSAKDDREMMAQSMNMTEEQTRYAATFSAGEAAVFTEGLVEPILLNMFDPWMLANQPPHHPLAAPSQGSATSIEDHTVQVWASQDQEKLWNPCDWCRCACRPRMRLLENPSPWWKGIAINAVISKVLAEKRQAAQEKRKAHIAEFASMLWADVGRCNHNHASDEELRCGLALACEQHIRQVAARHRDSTSVRRREMTMRELLNQVPGANR